MLKIIIEIDSEGIVTGVKFPEGIDPEIAVEFHDFSIPEDLNVHLRSQGPIESDDDGNKFQRVLVTQQVNNPGETVITPGGTR